jgi:hypothetical protein
MCYACRKKKYDRKFRPHTKISICKKQWEEWKQRHKCIKCGVEDPEVLQADHYIGKKEKELSNYSYWSKQGPEAQIEEFKKTRCLCRFCHNISTKKNFFKHKPNRLNTKKSRRDDTNKALKVELVIQEKMRRGECIHCQRKVTPETSNCFIFDHGKNFTKKNLTISTYINQNRSAFRNGKIKLEKEMNLCRLLCANCDWKFTREELWGHTQTQPWEEEQKIFYNF